MWTAPCEGAIHQTNVFQAFQGAQKLRAKPWGGLLVGVGLHRVVGVGGFAQGVEERPVVAVDQLGDTVLAQRVVVGLLVGGVCLGVNPCTTS
jgi:hypothetical protein